MAENTSTANIEEQPLTALESTFDIPEHANAPTAAHDALPASRGCSADGCTKTAAASGVSVAAFGGARASSARKGTLPDDLATIHEVQLVNYLRATGIDIGLLINFGPSSVTIRRKYRDGPSST